MQAQRSWRAVIFTAAAGLLGIAVAGCGGAGNPPDPVASVAVIPSAAASAAPSSGAVSCPAAGATAVSSASALSSALSSARPGEVIVLAPGVYPGDFVASASGTASAPITLCGSRNAILQGESIKSGYTFHLDHASWWRVEGFTVEGGQKGIMPTGPTMTCCMACTSRHRR